MVCRADTDSDSGRFSKADSADRFLIPVSSGGWVGGWVCGWVGVWVGGWCGWCGWCGVVWGGVGWCGVGVGWCGVVFSRQGALERAIVKVSV